VVISSTIVSHDFECSERSTNVHAFTCVSKSSYTSISSLMLLMGALSSALRAVVLFTTIAVQRLTHFDLEGPLVSRHSNLISHHLASMRMQFTTYDVHEGMDY